MFKKIKDNLEESWCKGFIAGWNAQAEWRMKLEARRDWNSREHICATCDSFTSDGECLRNKKAEKGCSAWLPFDD